MRSLIVSDLYNIKSILRNLLFALICISCVFLSGQDNGAYIVFCTTACSMLAINLFAMDERSNWLKYVLIMPATRRQYVYEKYIMGVLFTVAGFLFAIVVYFLSSILHVGSRLNMNQVLIFIACAFSVGLIFLSIYIPVLIRVGTEKARFIVLGLLVLPSVGGLAIVKGIEKAPRWIIQFGEAVLQHQTLVKGMIPVFLLGILLLSITFSIHFINKKEY